MINKLGKHKLFNIFMLLLMLWAAIESTYNFDNHQSVQTNQVSAIKVSHCNSTKAPISQICQQNIGSFCAILLNYFATFKSLSGIMVFLFIVALLTMSPRYRIDKPPKTC